jgi:hypothetical protein
LPRQLFNEISLLAPRLAVLAPGSLSKPGIPMRSKCTNLPGLGQRSAAGKALRTRTNETAISVTTTGTHTMTRRSLTHASTPGPFCEPLALYYAGCVSLMQPPKVARRRSDKPYDNLPAAPHAGESPRCDATATTSPPLRTCFPRPLRDLVHGFCVVLRHLWRHPLTGRLP